MVIKMNQNEAEIFKKVISNIIQSDTLKGTGPVTEFNCGSSYVRSPNKTWQVSEVGLLLYSIW